MQSGDGKLRPVLLPILLAPAFAAALMASLAASWLVLDRHWSPSFTLSVVLVGLAGLCGGLATAAILSRSAARAPSARLALAALTLLTVTCASLTLCIAIADMFLSPEGAPTGLAHRIEWFVLTTAASFYLVLGIATRLLLPAGLILLPLFCWAFVRATR